ITEKQCLDWANRFAAEKDAQYFNNTLGTLRVVIETGGVSREHNPAFKVGRLGVKRNKLELPEPDQFNKMLEVIESSNFGRGQAQHCADLVRFLAYSGCRISEARGITWADIDLDRGEIRVRNAKRAITSDAPQERYVPIIPPMRELLERLAKEPHLPSATVCAVGECQKSLTAACKKVGTKRITH